MKRKGLGGNGVNFVVVLVGAIFVTLILAPIFLGFISKSGEGGMACQLKHVIGQMFDGIVLGGGC